MTLPIIKSVALLLLLSISQLSFSADDFYVLGTGDKIKIQVFGESDLTVETFVSDSGVISYPFIGNLQIGGKQIASLEKELISRLSDGYLKNPDVTVVVIEYRKFYVDGHVASPGGVPYQPGMTVRKAVALVGGFGERASKEKIQILRASKGLDPFKVGLDDKVLPGDVITVDRSFW